MTWFGILVVVVYALGFIHNLIRIGQGGYVFEWTPGLLIVSTTLQVLIVLAVLFVGTGSL